MASQPTSPSARREPTAKDAPPPAAGNAADPNGDEDDDETPMGVDFIQGFADKIQRLPAELQDARPKIVIPKRGEKDFEPLRETVNLQEMMLQNSRQALFDALQGVRGMGSKSMSHALVTPASPYPQLIVSRGHVLDTVGITVRRPPPGDPTGKPVARVELLPEEALYMAERGSLQLWNGREPLDAAEAAAGVGAWCDDEFGISGAVEMSVMEAFGAYMGKEGLNWQRYQAYAFLKRLGYTVQRTRQFIPHHFFASADLARPPSLRRSPWAPVRAVARLVARVRGFLCGVLGRVASLFSLPRRMPVKGTAAWGWHGSTYASLLAHLRFIPAGHANPVPPAPAPVTAADPTPSSIYDPLARNPYLPFYNVWKPATNWSKAKWDRGSPEGLEQQKPDYIVAVIDSRHTPLPKLGQLDEVFKLLPDQPQGPPKRVGPQYERPPRPPRPQQGQPVQQSWFAKIVPAWLRPSSKPAQRTGARKAMGIVRTGDRAFIVAVNDSGNTGWVRFGRTGFENFVLV